MNWKKKLYSIKNSSILIVVFIILIGCKNDKEEVVQSRVEVLPFYNEASFTPKWFSKDNDSLKNFHAVIDFSLINQDGNTITNETFKDKIYVTDFFFTTCPGICPKMTANMDLIQDAFIDDDEVMLLSHSVTPETDSASVLKAFATEKGINSSKWHLVTGKRSEIYNLGRSVYFVEENLGEQKTDDDFLHTENFILVDKNKHIRGIYNGLNKTAINQLIADIKTLKKE
ncbi:SCO family protein [Flavobacterium gelidilacus]|uniref:SCO family protein n=1 Tax=Flavobacterium gelidilacus TaxID=206041 RepID=UPI00054EDA14|nr:SCO family protein [Flavobacterium gelidilacus]